MYNSIMHISGTEQMTVNFKSNDFNFQKYSIFFLKSISNIPGITSYKVMEVHYQDLIWEE